jgi:hypothetical protein
MADPTVSVTPPQRRPRKGGIRAVANTAPLERAFAAERVDWANLECAWPADAPGLCWGTTIPTAEKDRYGFELGGSAPIFALYGGAECYLNAGETYEEDARAVLTAGADRVIEAKLVEYLDTLDATPTAATSWVGVIAAAEQAADDTYLGQPVLVMNRGDAVEASAAGALSPAPADDGKLWTPNGTPVLASGRVPAGQVYVTGTITLYESSIVTSQAGDFTHNRQLAIAEQAFAFAIDCLFVVAYTVTITP